MGRVYRRLRITDFYLKALNHTYITDFFFSEKIRFDISCESSACFQF